MTKAATEAVTFVCKYAPYTLIQIAEKFCGRQKNCITIGVCRRVGITSTDLKNASMNIEQTMEAMQLLACQIQRQMKIIPRPGNRPHCIWRSSRATGIISHNFREWCTTWDD